MDDIYSKNYKKFMIIPLIVIIPVLYLVLFSPGVGLGIELTGGNVLIIRSETELSTPVIEEILRNNFDLSEVSVSTINSPTGYGAYIEYSKNQKVIDAESLIEKAQLAIESENDAEAILFSVEAIKIFSEKETSFDNAKTALVAAQDELAKYNEIFSNNLQNVLAEKLGLGTNVEFQRREVSPTLGKASLDSGLFVVAISALFLIIVIFISFRQVIPVLGIVFAMLYDVIFGLAGMALLNIPISLIAISTLLMVVGYSVDTDIMLTSRMLKDKEGTPGQRATSSVKTGLTMNATSLAAMLAMIAVSYLYQIDIVFQIAAILFFGLVGDLIATWFMNVSILMWFVEGKK